MVKIVYLIQSHKNPSQIERLVRTIKRSTPDAFILISHNFLSEESDYLDASIFEDLSNVKVLNGHGGRGVFSLVKGYLSAVDCLLNWGVEFDWLVNLTAQDYPTQPLTWFEDFLGHTEFDGFLEAFDIVNNWDNEWCREYVYPRYFYQYWQSGGYLKNWQRLLLKVPAKIINTFIPGINIDRSYGLMLGHYSRHPPFYQKPWGHLKTWQRSLLKIPAKIIDTLVSAIGIQQIYQSIVERYQRNSPFHQNKLTCYAGSYFHVLSKACVQYLSDYSKHHPELIRYYQNTLLPDESYIQTVLRNNPEFNFCNQHLRYIDWQGSKHGRPNIVTMKHYSELLDDQVFFARKFDFVTSQEVLERLDQRIFVEHQLAQLSESENGQWQTLHSN